MQVVEDQPSVLIQRWELVQMRITILMMMKLQKKIVLMREHDESDGETNTNGE